MSMIQVTNLTFAYDGTYDDIFKNVSFRVDTNWKLGLIGRNGRGKTTFLNLLMGKYSYSGSIQTDTVFEYFPYEVADKSAVTMDVMQSVAPECEEWEIMKELSLLDMEIDLLYQPFETLSNGEQTRVLLAALFLRSNRFLLIDEPTNHLDHRARQAVAAYLRRKKSFILVSHDRELLDQCVDHILSINRANIEVQSGNFSTWWQNKQLQDSFEKAENEKLNREIGRLTEASRRFSGWSAQAERGKFGVTDSGLKADRGYVGHKAAKVMKRAKSLEARQQAAIAEKSKLLHNVEEWEELTISPLEHPAELLVEAKDLSLFYGEKQVARNLSFQLKRGERIALNGGNGSGKSTLLKLISGEEIRHTGMLKLASGLVVSYLPQDTSHLQGDLSDYVREMNIDESRFKTILRKLGFERVQFEKDMAEFSGGQKKKVLIAASLCQRAHLYLWDEPLNFIDLFSRMQIEGLIRACQPTLLFVEHDSAFRKEISTRVIDLD